MPQEKAIDYFHQGYNCAQSVFAAFAEELGLSEAAALRLPPDAEEGSRPSERTAAYYAARPCECCVAFCAARAAEILGKD